MAEEHEPVVDEEPVSVYVVYTPPQGERWSTYASCEVDSGGVLTVHDKYGWKTVFGPTGWWWVTEMPRERAR